MDTTFEIINSNYQSVSNGLTKFMILEQFVEKKLSSKGFIIRDSEGMDMTFGEFMQFYID
jgi:hypothetical protein